jgi:hypothetical protein
MRPDSHVVFVMAMLTSYAKIGLLSAVDEVSVVLALSSIT